MTLKERIGSPFLSAFIVSWLIWNYRATMVALSIQPVKGGDKFAWFDAFYTNEEIQVISFKPVDWLWGVPDNSIEFLNSELLFKFPLYSAFFFVFLYPLYASAPFIIKQIYTLTYNILKIRIGENTPYDRKKTVEMSRRQRNMEYEHEMITSDLKEKSKKKDLKILEYENKEKEYNQKELEIEQIKTSLNEREAKIQEMQNKQKEEIEKYDNTISSLKNRVADLEVENTSLKLDLENNKNKNLKNKPFFKIIKNQNNGWHAVFEDPDAGTLFTLLSMPSKSHVKHIIEKIKSENGSRYSIQYQDHKHHFILKDKDGLALGFGQNRENQAIAKKDYEIFESQKKNAQIIEK